MYNTLYNKKPFTKEEEKTIVDNYIAGESLTLLASKFNCSCDIGIWIEITIRMSK